MRKETFCFKKCHKNDFFDSKKSSGNAEVAFLTGQWIILLGMTLNFMYDGHNRDAKSLSTLCSQFIHFVNNFVINVIMTRMSAPNTDRVNIMNPKYFILMKYPDFGHF